MVKVSTSPFGRIPGRLLYAESSKGSAAPVKGVAESSSSTRRESESVFVWGAREAESEGRGAIIEKVSGMSQRRLRS